MVEEEAIPLGSLRESSWAHELRDRHLQARLEHASLLICGQVESQKALARPGQKLQRLSDWWHGQDREGTSRLLQRLGEENKQLFRASERRPSWRGWRTRPLAKSLASRGLRHWGTGRTSNWATWRYLGAFQSLGTLHRLVSLVRDHKLLALYSPSR